MKKKILSLFVAICMIFPMAFSLVACDDGEKDPSNEATKQSTMASENITLAYESTVYDGTEKEPSVVLTYDDEIITSDNYTVSYLNNVDAGTATVVVKSNADSDVLAANLEFSTTFEIERAPIFVKNFAALNSAIQVTDKNHVITLAGNIEMVRDTTNSNYVAPVLIFPQENQDIAIDLAGYDINSYLWIASDLAGFPVSGAYYGLGTQKPNVTTTTDKTVKLSIYNSSNAESIIGFSNNEDDYAIVMKTNNDFDIDFEDVTFKGYWGALYTNGNYSSNTTLNAEDCKFIGTKVVGPTYDDVSAGAYVASGKIIYSYENCHFEGFSGYYAKSGHHYFSNCTVKAVGNDVFEKDHNGNGFYPTGSALVLDSCVGYSTVPSAGYQKALTVDISGGRFVSKSKHAIEEFSTYKVSADRISYAFVNIVDETVLESASGYKAMSFENAEAYHNHTYSNDSDSTCNNCGANRRVLGKDLWLGRTGEVPAETDGVIVISTADELAAFAAAVNAGNTFAGKTIELANNIDLNNIEWTPIGCGNNTTTKTFKGTFDGKGFTISNLKITNFVGGAAVKSATGVGLFGNVGTNGFVKNVNIDGARVDGNHYVAALIGYSYYAKVEDCSVNRATINCTHLDDDEDGDKAGVIFGWVGFTAINRVSVSNSRVKAGRDAGQIAGCIANTTTLRNPSASAVIVSANGTSTGANIKNEFVGRDVTTISLWYGSVGTLPEAVDNVITIKSADEFAAFAAAVNAGNTFDGYTIKLAKDIDLDNIEWTPIGYGYSNYVERVQYGAAFRGTFDGNGKTVYNLKVTTFVGGAANTNAATGVGLFGHIVSAEIKNIKVTGAEVDGNHYVGVVAGFSLNSNISKAEVKNASVSCVYLDADESGDKAGSVVGHFVIGIKAGDSAAITGCKATDCTVDADRDAGQLIGCVDNNPTQSGNTATRVTVTWNESGKNITAKTNTNIKNEIVGRVA